MFLLVLSRGTSEAPHRRRINRKQGNTMITIRRNHITSMGLHPGDQATDRNRRRVLATAFVLTTAIASIPSMASAVADGALDTTFGTGGKVTTTIRGLDEGKAIAIQSNGKILVVGDDMANFEIVRYNTDGSLDTTFDTDGKVTTDIGTSTTDTANAVAIQSDGKIVVAGKSGGMALNSGNFAVVRYNTDGSLDTTFDTDGKVTTDIGTSSSDTGSAVAIQSDSKIVVAGRIMVSGPPVFAVVRYEVTATSPSSSSTSSTSTTVAAIATTTTVAATTTTVAATTTTVAPKVVPIVSRKKAATLKSIAVFGKMTVPSGAKLTAVVATSSKTICRVTGTTVKGIKKGTCRVAITVKTKTGAKTRMVAVPVVN